MADHDKAYPEDVFSRFTINDRLTAERDELAARLMQAEYELQRLHSWAGLMELLDEHWPEDVWPTLPDSESRDTGARLVSLLRWVEQLSASVHCRSVERDAAVERAERAERLARVEAERKAARAELYAALDARKEPADG